MGLLLWVVFSFNIHFIYYTNCKILTTIGATEELEAPVTKKTSVDDLDLKEGQEGLTIGLVVAIKPIRQKDLKNGEPWLGIINDVSKNNIKVSWLMGNYETYWIPNPEFQGCSPDSVPRNRVACSFKYISDKILPDHIVDKLKTVFKI